MNRSRYSALMGRVPVPKGALLLAAGMLAGFLLSVMVNPGATQAAARNQYRVEQLDGMGARQPQALQDLLDKRAAEGWFLQALDHETLIFRKAAAPKPAPSPER